ncbi:hypothetical protein ACX93W_04685 [Paenibacillus sp. CAU 1782]
MSMLKRVICLTLLMALLAFPASAFASGFSAQDKNKSFISTIFSFFGGSTSNSQSSFDNYVKTNSYNPPKASFWNWFNKKNWWDCKDDSYKIWEYYYCY